MTAIDITPAFSVFADRTGKAMEGGYIYIGKPNLNPQTNQVAVFWDAALTIPAAQPIRTIGGYPDRSGSPGRIFTRYAYSINVRAFNGTLVYTAPRIDAMSPETYATITAMQASLEPSRGVGEIWTVGGWRYEEVTTGESFTTAGGVKLKYLPDAEIYLAALGWSEASTVAELSGYWAAGMALALSTGLRVVIPSGEFTVAQLNLPTFTANDSSQTPARQVRIRGEGQLHTKLSLAAGDVTSRYIIGHTSAGTLANRAQNSFVEICDMELLCRGDVTLDQPCIQLDNTWAPNIHHLLVGGNMGGANIDVYSYSRGGAQSGTFEEIRTMKHQQWVDGSSPTQYSLPFLRARGSRYLIRFRGPVDDIGKANNHKVLRCEAYYCAFGIVDTTPFAATGSPDYTSVTFPNGGGNDWISLTDCFTGHEGWQKIETGVFSAVGSQTTPTLIASGAVNTGADVFRDMVIRCFDPAADNGTGYWYSRRIVSMTSGRVITLASAFPFTITTSTQYEIAYADAKFWADGWHPGLRPHVALSSTRAYSFAVNFCRVEEGILLAKMSYGSANIDLFGNNIWSNRSEGLMIADSGAVERPIQFTVDAWHGRQAQGARSCNAQIGGQTLLLGLAEDASSPSVVMFRKINKTLLTLPSGTWVRMSTNQQDAVTPVADSAGSWTPHLYFWNPQERSGLPDDELSCILSGHLPASVWLTAGQVCNIGDAIISAAYGTSGNVGAVVTAAPPTGYKVLGRLTQAFTQGGADGSVKLWAMIRPMGG